MRTPTARTKIRQERTMRYFVEAADNIIREDGLQAVTIRKAADLAGYTSATLYNYFDDLYHLTFLATITHLEPYYRQLPKSVRWCSNSVERYLATAECFCQFAFREPEIYDLLFFRNNTEKLARYTGQYYELFPEKIVSDPSATLTRFFNVSDMHQRSRIQLDECIAEGFLCPNDTEDFNDITLMVFKCVLEKVQMGLVGEEEATISMMRYYSQLFHAYTRPEQRPALVCSLQMLREHSTPFCSHAYRLTPPGGVAEGGC